MKNFCDRSLFLYVCNVYSQSFKNIRNLIYNTKIQSEIG